MNINVRAIAFINGMVLCGLAIAMSATLAFDFIISNGKCWGIFAPSAFASVFFGGALILSCRGGVESISLSRQDTYLLVSSLWLVIAILSAIPFYVYDGVKVSFISALFEATSGITVTGASIYQNVEMLPKALNLWRFMLHFIGGVGIVAIGIVALPIMKVGGMQLFLTENSDKSQKLLPRASQIAGFFVGTYIIIISFFAVLLKINGMDMFDAVCHSISAIATGGFSTKNAGIEYFQSDKIKAIVAVAMLFGGVTFIEIVRGVKNGFTSFYSNQQTKGYINTILITLVFFVLISFIKSSDNISIGTVVDCFFEIVSSATTTYFASDSSAIKIPFFHIVLFILGIVGGCSGSTAGGVKIFRIQIIYSILKYHIKQVSRPFEVSIPKYQGQKIETGLVMSVISFFVLLIITIIISSLLISILMGKPGEYGIIPTVSCIFNLGNNLDIPNIPPSARLVLIVDMIVGRLDIVPILMIFTKSFWKK